MRALTALPTPTPHLVLEVVLTDPAHADRAGAVLTPLSAGTVVADGDVLHLAVRGRDGTIVRAVQLLHEAGLGARDLILRSEGRALRAA